MGLVATLDYGTPVRLGERFVSSGSLTFDSSYPSGGEPAAPGIFGFRQVLEAIEFGGGSKGFQFEYDRTAGTIKVMGRAQGQRILNPDQAATTITGAPAVITTFHVTRPTYVMGVYSVVTTLMACETIQPVMSVDKADPDGASNAVELATITYGATDAVGVLDSYRVPSTAVGGGASAVLTAPYLVAAGYTILVRHKTTGTGAAAAGAAKITIAVATVHANVELGNAHNLSALSAVRFLAFGR